MPMRPLLEESPARKHKPRDTQREGVLFAVYAPLGGDEALSRYPNPDKAAPIAPIGKQALVLALQQVAAEGIDVCALVDVFDDDSYLVEIPAGNAKGISIVSAWKQDMSAPQALAGFLRRAHQRFPCRALVLALEGHGGGFVPDIDSARITAASASNWSLGAQSGKVRWVQSEADIHFAPDGNSPALPMMAPTLPMMAPTLPATRLPMSTWALGAALRNAQKAGVPRPAVVHFNNCFNASTELLHTVAPYADHATGYANYDFFTAGATYPKVFHRLRLAGSATPAQLASWFAEENGLLLKAKKNHPSVGSTVALAAMPGVASAINKLAAALTAALRPANAADRPAALARIKQAVVEAQHYDTAPGFELKVPDQFVDVSSLALALQTQFGPGAVAAAATALLAAVGKVWRYGDWDRPWMDETRIWDFRQQHLGLNILLPDPALQGIWDWRSPYYLSGTVDASKAPAHRHVINFLADTNSTPPPWVEFIVEYHRDVPFVGFMPALAPFFPLFNKRFKGQLPHPGDEKPGTPGQR